MITALRSALYTSWHSAKRDGVNRANRELSAQQWLSREILHELQQRKLGELLNFAASNVPYYRSLFEQQGVDLSTPLTPDSLRLLPSLSKDVIRRQHDRMVSENLQGNTLYSNSTSGSTGEALRFYTDERSTPWRKAAEQRSDTYTGWRFGEPVVRLWGAPMDESLASGLRGRLHGWVTGNRFLSSFELSDTRMDEYIQIIREFKPAIMIAYPGPLEEFSKHCGKRGVSFPSLRAVISSAETLWPHQRQIIEEVLGVRVFNRYGAREVGQIGSECEAHNGQHISVDRLLLEIVDDEGQPCAPGEEGRMLITDLDNYGMPLIRYEIGDYGALAESSKCVCGRGLPLLRQIEGRTLDVVRTQRGDRIGGTFWTLLLRSKPGLQQFQVVQRNLDGITINYVPDTGFELSVLEGFTDKIRQTCGSDFRVEYVEKQSIELTVSGKQKLIMSLIENAESA